jgi:hypothetical protein
MLHVGAGEGTRHMEQVADLSVDVAGAVAAAGRALVSSGHGF